MWPNILPEFRTDSNGRWPEIKHALNQCRLHGAIFSGDINCMGSRICPVDDPVEERGVMKFADPSPAGDETMIKDATFFFSNLGMKH